MDKSEYHLDYTKICGLSLDPTNLITMASGDSPVQWHAVHRSPGLMSART